MLKTVRNADINLLQVFVAVAESGGIAAAQLRLGVSPSTIGTQIAHLETRIGLRLCNRGRAGFSLTEEGEVVLAAAYELFRDHERFSQSIYRLEKEILGTIKISVIDGLIHNPGLRLSDCIADLRQNYPRLQFEIRQSPHKQLEQQLLTGETDLAVTFMPATLPSLSTNLLFEEEQIICCGHRHPLFERAPGRIRADELENHDWVTDGYALPSSVPFSKPPIFTAKTKTIEGICYFVLAGTHIAYMPKPFVQHWLDRDLIRTIIPDRFNFMLPISLVTRRATAHDKKITVARDTFLRLHGNGG